jgi:SNF2 family DNA or RNA helicase
VIYYANDFNLETRMQSEDRCHRIGQEDKVTYIDLICEGTIDEKIVKSLTGKIKLSAEVLGENIKEWLKIPKK